MGDSSATIDGNQIYQNGNGSSSGPSAGICLPDNTSTKIYNNIIRNNYNSGINVLGNSTPVIVNNIIAHHRGPANSPGRAIKVIHTAATPITSVKLPIILFTTRTGVCSAKEKNSSQKTVTITTGKSMKNISALQRVVMKCLQILFLQTTTN